MEKEKTEKLVEMLSPIERKILPHVMFVKEEIAYLDKLVEKSGLDETSSMHALKFLASKGIIKLNIEKKKIVELGDNGVNYLKHGLPERKLLSVLTSKNEIQLSNAKITKLSDNEFKAAIGALKKKAMAEIKEGKLILATNKQEIAKKMLEEQLLEALPLKLDELKPEQLHAFENLKDRRNILIVEEKKELRIELTEIGKEISPADLSKADSLIENLTPEIIKTESWKGKKFRRYDLASSVPEISGGKRHFVNQAIEYGRKLWLEMGFKEMTGNLVQEGFWNFDALFTAQDHPVRELQDTFYIKNEKGKLPDKKIVEKVKKSHEEGVDGSKGWQYKWEEKEAEKLVLRTHTTCLSAQTLAKLQERKNKTGKFFAIGKCFRNETVDSNHGFEFNQAEGIVISENVNFKHLIGYLKEFARRMGYEKVRFRPHYFPYTEPSLEADGWDEEKKEWIEIIGAGIFRPEVTEPLLGKPVPVLAWGPGFDRMMKMLYKISDFRDVYKNDLEQLRKIKFWGK